ncbi:MAG: hypothetical protein JWN52_1282 [Actinomycetia bacterium]|nr:hypothetical protein [Actinomycetes bacterium]
MTNVIAPDVGPSADVPADEETAPAAAQLPAARTRQWPFLSRPFLRSHRVFLVAVTLGVALRIVTMLGYRWAMWFMDAYQYVQTAIEGGPHLVRPDGYAFFLKALMPFHRFALVTSLQHLMGIGTAVMIYALLWRRFNLPGWLATLAAVPVLLDAYEIQLEHMILSDTLFTFLMTALVTTTLWWKDITVTRGAALGLLLSVTALTRSIGLGLLLVMFAYLVFRRVGWRVVTVVVVTAAIPLLGYAQWFQSAHGRFALSNSDGPFLYARVMKFADCDKFSPPPTVEEIPLCIQTPPGKRLSSQFYVWGTVSPLHRLPDDIFDNRNSLLAGQFARHAITSQPGDYLEAVAYDVARVFEWNRHVFPDATTYNRYEFQKTSEPTPEWAKPYLAKYEPGRSTPRIVEPFAGFMHFYQKYFFLRGTLLGVILLIGLAGMARAWRRWGGPALLPMGAVAALLVAPAATAEFDYRYVVPAIPMACLAAGLALRDLPTYRLLKLRKLGGRNDRNNRDEETVSPVAGELIPEKV